MKKLISLIAIIFFSITISFAQLPLYLNFGSHNETIDTFDYINSNPDYQLIKGIAKQIADSIIAHNARWNMQVESNFIRGCIIHENAATNSTDFLQWADATPNIEVDVHNHFQPPFLNPYNPSDLAHLLDSCGLTPPRNNIGGFIWKDFTSPSVSEDWTQYQIPVAGYKYPFYSWQPKVIWGGGSPGHIDDYNAYGIWKPSAPTVTDFATHNATNYLTCIGNGCAGDFVLFDTTNEQDVLNNLVSLINYLQAQPTDDSSFYTATIMMNFKNFNSPGFVQKVSTVLSALDSYAATNKIIWSTLTEKYNMYHAIHTNPNDHFVRRCEDVNVGIENVSSSGSRELNLYPNPVNDNLSVSSAFLTGESSWKIFSVEGKNILEGKFTDKKLIDVHSLPSGIYFLKIESNKVNLFNKFLKTDY